MIVDAHIHLFDPSRPGGVPWPPADSSIYRPTLPANLEELATPVGVRGAVCVECSRLVEDNQWTLDQAKRSPYILAVVGNLDPGTEMFGRHLQRFAADPLFRGIRIRPEGAIEWGARRFEENLGLLAERGLVAEVVAPDPTQAAHCAAVAARWPTLRIMLDHMAHPTITEHAPDPTWANAVAAFGPLPNVWCKVSRLTEAAVQQPAPLEMEYYQLTLRHLRETFGVNRLVFGSNWPPCLKAGDYCATVTLLRDYLRAEAPGAMERVFFRNAAVCYGGPRFAALANRA